jgi:hypothetical protein
VGGEQVGETRTEGWFWPTGARKAHYDGGDGRALCGKWGRYGLGGVAPFLAEQGGDGGGPDDCAGCSKRLVGRRAKAEAS